MSLENQQLKIISGGQTGVDRAALDVGLTLWAWRWAAGVPGVKDR